MLFSCINAFRFILERASMSTWKHEFGCAFASSNLGSVSPINTMGAKCINIGLPCDFVSSTCNNQNQLCIAFGSDKDKIEHPHNWILIIWKGLCTIYERHYFIWNRFHSFPVQIGYKQSMFEDDASSEALLRLKVPLISPIRHYLMSICQTTPLRLRPSWWTENSME